MKRIIALMVTFLVSMSFAHAEWIGEFPGLDKLIKDADAIAILRVDHSECDFGGMEPYSTHNCYVVRRAKQGASYQVKDLLFQNLASRNYRVLQLC